jgi:5-(carboxyamino)imidazole ribonucleotide synthase
MTIGILGGGQLGYMLALAGYPIGLRFRILDPSPDAPAGMIAPHIAATYEDRDALKKFSDGLEAVTYEFENVPVETAKYLSERSPVYPPIVALEEAQDRVREKNLFQKLGIPVADFVEVRSAAALDSSIRRIGLPAVLKTTRMGYDGKGQWALRTQEDVDKARAELPSTPLILEKWINFERELSMLAVRSRDGQIHFYPLVENHHRGGILRLSIAPAPMVSPALQIAAEGAARQVLEALGYVGVLCIEFFEVGGRLLANEMAPRVHNSGHWTIEGAVCSQFENHLRAVAGLPLGATAAHGYSAMLNLIGELPNAAEVLQIPGAHLHLYGKEPRPGRKVGHVTLRAATLDQLQQRLRQLPPFFQRPEFCLDRGAAAEALGRRA